MKPPQKISIPFGSSGFEIITGTQLPHSPDCEEYLLSAVMADYTPASWALCCSLMVKPKAFFVQSNREIWTAIHNLRLQGVPEVDLPKVHEDLKIRGRLEEAGGMPHLIHVSSRVATDASTRFFAEHLVLLWHMRHAVGIVQEVREAVTQFEGREAFAATASDIGQRLMRLGRLNPSKSLNEEIVEVMDDVTVRTEGRVDQTRWISSGLPTFDAKCKPLTGGREDQLIVVGGGSGVGKSAVLRQLGLAALLQGKTVLSICKETSTAGFAEMMIASWTEFDLLNPELYRGTLPVFQEKCAEMRDRWADKLLFCIEHSAGAPLQTIEDLEDHVHAFVNLRGNPNMILVDYLQLFGTRKRLGSREETVATVSHRLQALVREMPGTTMVVAVQLNETGLDEMRQVRREERADGAEGKVIHRFPKPGDIRESQAIYHDADRMIFLYKPPIDCRNEDQRAPGIMKPEVWWFQEKRRRGGVGYVRCWFEKRFTRFVEVGRHEAEAADEAQQSAMGHISPGGIDKSKFKKPRP